MPSLLSLGLGELSRGVSFWGVEGIERSPETEVTGQGPLKVPVTCKLSWAATGPLCVMPLLELTLLETSLL